MAHDTKAIQRIAILLAIGLVPALAMLVLSPNRGIALVATGNATMAAAFVLWTDRLVADARQRRTREAALRNDLASLEEALTNQARELRDAKSHDAATAVLNRAAFLRRLDDAITRDARLGKSLTFLAVDVEGFKALNIDRGRSGGDAILKRVARALEDATRGSDCVGRLGGDEFGVVLNECEDPGPAVNRIFENLQADAGGDPAAVVRVAVGAVTIESPAAGVDVQELFRLADAALASVRGTGGNLCAKRTMRPASDRHAATA